MPTCQTVVALALAAQSFAVEIGPKHLEMTIWGQGSVLMVYQEVESVGCHPRAV